MDSGRKTRITRSDWLNFQFVQNRIKEWIRESVPTAELFLAIKISSVELEKPNLIFPTCSVSVLEKQLLLLKFFFVVGWNKILLISKASTSADTHTHAHSHPYTSRHMPSLTHPYAHKRTLTHTITQQHPHTHKGGHIHTNTYTHHHHQYTLSFIRPCDKEQCDTTACDNDRLCQHLTTLPCETHFHQKVKKDRKKKKEICAAVVRMFWDCITIFNEEKQARLFPLWFRVSKDLLSLNLPSSFSAAFTFSDNVWTLKTLTRGCTVLAQW